MRQLKVKDHIKLNIGFLPTGTQHIYPVIILFANFVGFAYGWNSNGIVFSENAVSPTKVVIGGLGDNFLSRDLFSAVSIDDAIQKVSKKNRAYGFSLNIGDLSTLRLFNVEVAADGVGVYEVVKGNYSHTNMYQHLDVSQYPDPSSIARNERIWQFTISGSQDMLDILGDTKNPQYPIYRNGNPPDCCSTASSVLYDLANKKASVFDSNPKTSQPWKSFDL